jgi:hypothetical protein
VTPPPDTLPDEVVPATPESVAPPPPPIPIEEVVPEPPDSVVTPPVLDDVTAPEIGPPRTEPVPLPILQSSHAVPESRSLIMWLLGLIAVGSARSLGRR